MPKIIELKTNFHLFYIDFGPKLELENCTDPGPTVTITAIL